MASWQCIANTRSNFRSDRLLTADLAVVGVGVTPASDIANNVAGLDVDGNGFIPVDSSMATSLPGVWAAGDVAAFPLQGFSEERVTIGHWGLAMYLGKTAALAMLGRQVSSNLSPFVTLHLCYYILLHYITLHYE